LWKEKEKEKALTKTLTNLPENDKNRCEQCKKTIINALKKITGGKRELEKLLK